jgi:ribosome-associated protein
MAIIARSTRPPRRRATGGGEALLALTLKILDDGKAEDVVVIDLAGKTDIADHMVIATGRSARQVAALADHLASSIKEGGHGRPSVEGLRVGDWVLIDAGDVLVHLFRPDVRDFYHLEKMWGASFPEAVGLAP